LSNAWSVEFASTLDYLDGRGLKRARRLWKQDAAAAAAFRMAVHENKAFD